MQVVLSESWKSMLFPNAHRGSVTHMLPNFVFYKCARKYIHCPAHISNCHMTCTAVVTYLWSTSFIWIAWLVCLRLRNTTTLSAPACFRPGAVYTAAIFILTSQLISNWCYKLIFLNTEKSVCELCTCFIILTYFNIFIFCSQKKKMFNCRGNKWDCIFGLNMRLNGLLHFFFAVTVNLKWKAGWVYKCGTDGPGGTHPHQRECACMCISTNNVYIFATESENESGSWRRAETRKGKQTISLSALLGCHTLPALPEQTSRLKTPGLFFPAAWDELLWPQRAASCQA